jgi:hypothetical protein
MVILITSLYRLMTGPDSSRLSEAAKLINMKIDKLLKEYSFTEVQQYYDMIVGSVTNGQKMQAKSQFTQLPRDQRIAFLRWLVTEMVTMGGDNTDQLEATFQTCIAEIY